MKILITYNDQTTEIVYLGKDCYNVYQAIKFIANEQGKELFSYKIITDEK